MSDTYSDFLRELGSDGLYEIKNIAKFEAHVDEQINSGTYDFTANRHLLKLYQFSPDSANQACIVKILIKSLMALPSSDFAACCFLLNKSILATEEVSALVALCELLESAKYDEVWKQVEQGPAASAIKGVKQFATKVQEYIYGTVMWAHQTVETKQLASYLNVAVDSEVLNALLEVHGGTKSEDGATIQLPISSFNHFDEHEKANSTQKISISEVSKLFAYV